MDNDDIFEGELVENSLAGWLVPMLDRWKDHYRSNHMEKHEEYFRIWRGIWSSKDKERESERSRLIAPATQQAVDSVVAEIETATFAGARYFDIKDDPQDPNQDAQMMVDQLHHDLNRADFRSSCIEAVTLGAVCGTGAMEAVIEDSLEIQPASKPVADGQATQFGVNKRNRPMVRWNPVLPQNLIVDPACTSPHDAMGVGVMETVSKHRIEMLIHDGVYNNVNLLSLADIELSKDPEADVQPQDVCEVRRYYGLVPTDLLIQEGAEVKDKDALYTEAWVVLVGDQLAKAIENPLMVKKRPLLAFQFDTLPGSFWGRGVPEKAYHSQKALNAELRARVDALALTTQPMMAIRAGAIPRGKEFSVRPGKNVFTTESPNQDLMPLNFGKVDQITFAQAEALQNMVQQATGAVDSAALARAGASEATTSGISMSLGAVMKRQKHTLVNFQENLFRPAIELTAFIYMQFDPERYPASDYEFRALSSLGIMAREVEVGQLSQVLQVTKDGSPMYGALVKAIISHLNVSNREELLEIIEKSSQPNPKLQQAQEEEAALRNGLVVAQTSQLAAQAKESKARADKYEAEAKNYGMELYLRYGDQDNDGEPDYSVKDLLEIARALREEEDFEVRQAERIQALQAQQPPQPPAQQPPNPPGQPPAPTIQGMNELPNDIQQS